MKEFFIIIPCYKPTSKLKNILEKISPKIDNIILVDDGNSAKKKRYLVNLIKKKLNIKLLSHPINLGKGASIKTALSYIMNNFKNFKGCVVVDADGQHHNLDILKILTILKKNKEKNSFLILGHRNFSKDIPFKSYIGNKLSNIIYSYLLNFKFLDTQTGLRGFNKNFAEASMKIIENRFEFETEQLILARQTASKIQQLPIQTIYFNKNKETSFNPILDSFKIYFLVLRQLFISLLVSIIDFIIFFKISNTENVIESNLIARSIIILLQFYLFKKFVYKDNLKNYDALIIYSLFVFIMGYISSLLQINLSEVYEINKNFSKIIIESGLFLINFSFIKTIVFRKN